MNDISKHAREATAEIEQWWDEPKFSIEACIHQAILADRAERESCIRVEVHKSLPGIENWQTDDLMELVAKGLRLKDTAACIAISKSEQKDAEISRLKEEIYTYSKWKDTRLKAFEDEVERLKELLEQRRTSNLALELEMRVKQVHALEHQKKEMAEILDATPHFILALSTNRWIPHHPDILHNDCPACRWQKLKESL